jgi:hypothetical protein
MSGSRPVQSPRPCQSPVPRGPFPPGPAGLSGQGRRVRQQLPDRRGPDLGPPGTGRPGWRGRPAPPSRRRMISTATNDLVSEPMRYWTFPSGSRPAIMLREQHQTWTPSCTTAPTSDGARPSDCPTATRCRSARRVAGSNSSGFAYSERRSLTDAPRAPRTENAIDVIISGIDVVISGLMSRREQLNSARETRHTAIPAAGHVRTRRRPSGRSDVADRTRRAGTPQSSHRRPGRGSQLAAPRRPSTHRAGRSSRRRGRCRLSEWPR